MKTPAFQRGDRIAVTDRSPVGHIGETGTVRTVVVCDSPHPGEDPVSYGVALDSGTYASLYEEELEPLTPRHPALAVLLAVVLAPVYLCLGGERRGS